MYKLTLAILATLIAAIYSRDVESLISTVNQKQSSWVAGHNKFSGMPLDEVKKILGLRDTRATPEQLRLGDSVYEKPLYTTADNDLPEEYDGRKQWGACLQPVRNQEHCGSCWAFSAAETLGNRFCRASNGTVNVVLSPQDLVSCSYLNFGCNGGTLPMVWASMYFSGIVPDKCMPYVSGDGHVPSCPAVCPGGGEYAGKTLKSVKYFAKSIYPLWVDMPSRRVNDMKKDLIEHGAIQVGFSVYEDFLQYKSGVYQHTSGGFLGGHAVVIIGYTRDAWIVRNSWSESWGENGDFRIRIGHDECGIEGGAWAGLPKVN